MNGSERSILLVDDDRELLRILALFLRVDGWQVQVALTGPAAVSLLSTSAPPSLILSDITMPDMDGAELIRIIAGIPALDRVPVVQMSAIHREKVSGRVAAVLMKPLKFPEVLPLLREVAGRVPAGQGARRGPRSS